MISYASISIFCGKLFEFLKEISIDFNPGTKAHQKRKFHLSFRERIIVIKKKKLLINGVKIIIKLI